MTYIDVSTSMHSPECTSLGKVLVLKLSSGYILQNYGALGAATKTDSPLCINMQIIKTIDSFCWVKKYRAWPGGPSNSQNPKEQQLRSMSMLNPKAAQLVGSFCKCTNRLSLGCPSSLN